MYLKSTLASFFASSDFFICVEFYLFDFQTHYHVVFFDTNNRLSRSWVKIHYLKLFTEVVKISSSRPRDYIERFKRSVKEAKEAMSLSLEERLKRYSFTERLKMPGTKLCQDQTVLKNPLPMIYSKHIPTWPVKSTARVFHFFFFFSLIQCLVMFPTSQTKKKKGS